MTTQHWHSVASGKPYPVTVPPVDGSSSLDAFLGDAEFTIGGGGEPMVVRGHGSQLGELIRFHEKDAVGGKDVRVWHVSRVDGAFVAETVSAF
jgi:hypothetical protein